MEVVVILILGLLAATAVAYPLISDRAGRGPDDAVLDAHIARYREALRAGTVCENCSVANPPGSRYCSECGRQLPLAAGAGDDARVKSTRPDE